MELEIFPTPVCARTLHQKISLEALERIQRKKVVFFCLMCGELLTFVGASLQAGGGCPFSNPTAMRQERLVGQTPDVSREHVNCISF